MLSDIQRFRGRGGGGITVDSVDFWVSENLALYI